MAYPIKDFQQTVGNGVGTWSYTVPVAGSYTVASFTTITPPTGISVAIQLNGSNVLTSGALNSATSQYNLEAFIACAVSDVLSVVISSNAPTTDLSIPTAKTVIALRLGK